MHSALRFYPVLLLAALASRSALAVPSFARQMGLQCTACHTEFPQLNAFGRLFKLSGYTLGAPVPATEGGSGSTAVLAALPPLSVMLQAAYTGLGAAEPGSQNNSAQLPQQASLFIAGRITPSLGSFVQLTYSQADGEIGMDNAELRYSHQKMLHGKPVIYGAVLNNNPTLEDPWNSTPAWGFPWAAPDAPEPIATPLLDGVLAQDVMGVGGFALFDNKFYVASTLYRSAHIGSETPGTDSQNTIDNVAVYWRVAWQHAAGTRSYEIGGYGLHANLVPEGVSGPTDGYDDYAADVQYEQVLGSRNFIAHATYINENEHLTASALAGAVARPRSSQRLLKLDAGLYGSVKSKVAYVLGHRRGHGDLDPVRFAPEAVDGSANGKPDSTAWVAEVIFSPWENVQLRAQYTAYTKFNGASSNYDGFGRNARDNNSLFLNAWFAW